MDVDLDIYESIIYEILPGSVGFFVGQPWNMEGGSSDSESEDLEEEEEEEEDDDDDIHPGKVSFNDVQLLIFGNIGRQG